MHVKLIGTIRETEVIATGRAIRERERLRRAHGPGRWRKLKGIATVKRQAPGWLRQPGGRTLVRGARHRAPGDQDQAAAG
jgi:hypothetical protein